MATIGELIEDQARMACRIAVRTGILRTGEIPVAKGVPSQHEYIRGKAADHVVDAMERMKKCDDWRCRFAAEMVKRYVRDNTVRSR